MTASAERVTRVSEELFQAASAAGSVEHRSAKQQLEHWARIGQSVDAHTSTSRRRVSAAMEGRLPVTALTYDEGVAFDAFVETELAERIASTDVGEILRGEGVTTVSLNGAGQLVEHRPDGTSAIVSQREPVLVRARKRRA